MRNPIVIGGIGGSGTRLICSLLIKRGAHMGKLVSRTGDSLELWHFNNIFLNPLLKEVHRVDYRLADVPAPVRRSTLAGLTLAIRILRTRFADDGGPWGFKCPRTIYILPFLNRLLPQFVFVHVVRDGRDMVLSDNQRQLARHYEALFGEPLGADREVCQALLWNRVNDQAARWAQKRLAGRYHVIRFEDLCAQPAETIERFLRFLESPASPEQLAELAREVSPPSSIGRWRDLDSERAARLTQAMQDGLTRFGYLS